MNISISEIYLPYRMLADIVVLLHFAFIAFILLGGILLFWWPKMAWIHLPMVGYAILIEWIGWICPLTPFENWLRYKGGETGSRGGFVAQYILPFLYPVNYTYTTQLLLGAGVLSINLIIYRLVLLYRTKKNKSSIV